MEKYKLSDFTKGWVVGDFEPTIIPTKDFEFMVREYKKGDKDARHVHKVAHEVTVFVSGVYKMNGVLVRKGDVIHLKPGTASEFECIEDGAVAVIKTPSVKGDKYPV